MHSSRTSRNGTAPHIGMVFKVDNVLWAYCNKWQKETTFFWRSARRTNAAPQQETFQDNKKTSPGSRQHLQQHPASVSVPVLKFKEFHLAQILD